MFIIFQEILCYPIVTGVIMSQMENNLLRKAYERLYTADNFRMIFQCFIF
jgi:hypothetical protein